MMLVTNIDLKTEAPDSSAVLCRCTPADSLAILPMLFSYSQVKGVDDIK